MANELDSSACLLCRSAFAKRAVAAFRRGVVFDHLVDHGCLIKIGMGCVNVYV